MTKIGIKKPNYPRGETDFLGGVKQTCHTLSGKIKPFIFKKVLFPHIIG